MVDLRQYSKWDRYNILDTPQKLDEVSRFLENLQPEFVAVDTETNGLAFYKDVIIGISFAIDQSRGFYIPLLEWIPDEQSQKTRKVDKVDTSIFEHGEFRDVWTDARYSEDVTNKDYTPPTEIQDFVRKHFLETDSNLLMHNAPFDILMFLHHFNIDLSQRLFCDTGLLKHVIDENTKVGLKDTVLLWKTELGIDSEDVAKQEQVEMKAAIIKNGGVYNARNKAIWRADLAVLGKYACADSFFTYGIFEVGMDKFDAEFDDKHYDWFFEDEVMPLCREVVVDMKNIGIRIDVPYFEQLERETRAKLEELEDEIIQKMGSLLDDFSRRKSFNETVTKKDLVLKIMELEGLEHPVKVTKSEQKPSLAKDVVKKEYQANPHWLWGYLLGEDAIKYSDERIAELKQQIFTQKNGGRRYRFNVNSDEDLRWLFCDKLGHDRSELPQTDSATKSNPIPSVKADVIKQYFSGKYEFVKPLLLYKKVHKQYITYIVPALEMHYDGWLYVDMKQNGTVSGRFSCSGGYNLQTLPRKEELECSKCGSSNLKTTHKIQILVDTKCEDCGNVDQDIFSPSAIKRGFIAPEGMKIIAADYSSLEPRCFAVMSGEEKIKDVYRKGLDFYSKIYCDMLDGENKYSASKKDDNFLKKIYPQGRTMIKPVALGIPYGCRDAQTANLMGLKKSVTYVKKDGSTEVRDVLDYEEGARYRRLYLDTYPNLEKYMLEQEAKALESGHVETIVGRRRHFQVTRILAQILKKAQIGYEEFLDMRAKDVKTKHINAAMTERVFQRVMDECGFDLYDSKKKQWRDWNFLRAIFKNELNNAKNMPIQGLAAHITNMGMLMANRAFREAGLTAVVILNIHDEIVCYVKEDEVEEAAALLRKAMEDNKYTRLLDLEMIAEPLIGYNLNECK